MAKGSLRLEQCDSERPVGTCEIGEATSIWCCSKVDGVACVEKWRFGAQTQQEHSLKLTEDFSLKMTMKIQGFLK